MGVTRNGKPRTMFRPQKKGGAVGIAEIKKWADAGDGRSSADIWGCDSGFCV